MAARRVADENRQLRELLHKHGATDDYIAQYLLASTANNADSSHGQGQNVQVMDPATAPQSLQQLMLPRRAPYLEPSVQLTLPSQSSREASIVSGSTTNSSAWESSQPTMTGYSHHAQQFGVPPSAIGSSDQHQYAPSIMFHAQPGSTQADPLQRPPSGHVMNDPRQGLATTQPISIKNSTAINYQFQMSTFHDPAHRYDPPGGL
ncbi:hypothetical protein EsDP_00000041 [Epichloe bromicola]|uniref:Uncharacterized protein n=1 Tax=Epichloe bromicola TaxID=79588 RepID=A0ABQ0CDS6_9HYPO